MNFCIGDQKSIKAISNLLSRYASCLGKIYNASKSLIYVGAMSKAKHKNLAYIFRFYVAYPPFLYLGVSIFVGRPKAYHFQFIADMVKIKLAVWNASLLSIAERV